MYNCSRFTNLRDFGIVIAICEFPPSLASVRNCLESYKSHISGAVGISRAKLTCFGSRNVKRQLRHKVLIFYSTNLTKQSMFMALIA